MAGGDQGLSARRRRAFAVVVGLASTAAALLAAEGLLRLRDARLAAARLRALPPVDQRRLVPSDDPALRFELHARHRDATAWSAGAARVAVGGDSITCDAPPGGGWHRALERALARAGAPARCRSFAVTGYSLGQTARALEVRALPERPDLLLVQLCLNDPYTSDTDYGSEAPMPSRLLLALLWRASPARARAWYHVERNYDAQGWRNVEAGLDRLAALAKQAPVALVLFPYLHRAGYDAWGLADVHAGWAERARARGLPLIDLRADLDASISDAPLEDAIHPDAAGHEAAGRAVARELLARGSIRAR